MATGTSATAPANNTPVAAASVNKIEKNAFKGAKNLKTIRINTTKSFKVQKRCIQWHLHEKDDHQGIFKDVGQAVQDLAEHLEECRLPGQTYPHAEVIFDEESTT